MVSINSVPNIRGSNFSPVSLRSDPHSDFHSYHILSQLSEFLAPIRLNQAVIPLTPLRCSLYSE